MWLQISTRQLTMASLLAGAGIVGFSGGSDAAEVHGAITPSVKCEALAGLGFAGSTLVIEKAEAVAEAPAGTVQVRDGHSSSWRPAPGSRGNGWHPPQWGPSRYYGGWVPYGGPGVPTYWVWGSQGGAWDYPFADWRGPHGGWGNP